VCAAAGAVPVAVVGALMVGLGDGPQLAALLAVRHREAPAGLRGQVFGTAVSVKLTAFALGAAVGGPLVTASVPVGLATAATAQLAAVAVMWPRHDRPPRHWPRHRPRRRPGGDPAATPRRPPGRRRRVGPGAGGARLRALMLVDV
jgi:MFS family permease